MRWQLKFGIALTLLIFAIPVMAQENKEAFSKENTLTLNLCSDDTIGYKIKCNPDWFMSDEKNSVMMIIIDGEDVMVTATINKSNEKGISMGQLTPEKLRFIGQYGDEIRIDRTRVAGLDAIKVKATAKDVSQMQLLDYYIVKDKHLYSVLFAVNPKEKFAEYENLFEEMINSFEFIGH